MSHKFIPAIFVPRRFLLISLIILLSIFYVSGQRKPVPKTKAVKPQSVEKITTQKAVTENGKAVILKSNGTWEYAPTEAQIVQKQTPEPKKIECSAALADSPDIRTLRLGMTRAEVQDAFGVPSNSEKSPFYYFSPTIEPNGVYSYIFYSSTLEKLPKFYNADRLRLEFYEGRVHLIGIKYAASAGRFSLEEFKSKISESFNLPLEAWSGSTMQCRDFKVFVEPGMFGDYLEVTNLITTGEINQNEKKKRDVFKP